ncbi:hypothetical protein [Agriterribacter sp.]|uniref:hypothetical protein n=1 Tax=Agriterribacter sp. TaxID=2821509 RepID=UPI002BBED994|nr:hypothetical protein [Agriterribacter sp.]HRO46817.1 hypothetical protein [Agriterribacter sp.]HRQ15574.1 hypothetical protein [Agriterribacter sp.]
MILTGRTPVVLLLLLLITGNTYTQHFDLAAEELQKIRNAYSGTGYNSFTIQYQYAMESAPEKIADALTVYFKIKGSNYYCKTDNMEFIQNDSVNAAIYHNEKTIVLTNATAPIEKGRLVIDDWDSAFIAANIHFVSITDNKATRTLVFHFAPESDYSRCSITYNKNTFLPQRIDYIQRATQNLEAGKTKPNGIIITAKFLEHSKAAFKETIFDYTKFIKKQNNKWATVATYESYSVVNNVY